MAHKGGSKMKKLYIVLAVLLSFGIMKAYTEDIRNVPGAGNQSSIPADYGGVDIATNSFIVGLATVPTENGPQGIGYRRFYASTTTVGGVFSQNRWTIYGVNFSTGACPVSGVGGDFVSIQVSSASANAARELTRIYNIVAVGTGSVCGGVGLLRWPIRTYGNLFWGVDTGLMGGNTANPLNRADLLYYFESQ